MKCRLCSECSYKLNYTHKKKEVTKKSKKRLEFNKLNLCFSYKKQAVIVIIKVQSIWVGGIFFQHDKSDIENNSKFGLMLVLQLAKVQFMWL